MNNMEFAGAIIAVALFIVVAILTPFGVAIALAFGGQVNGKRQ